MSVLTYPEAAVVGLFQGVAELFPVSSLGHSVLIPALIGGSWERDLNVQNSNAYLAFIVGLHVATALALLLFFRKDWIRIIGGFFSSIRDRRIETADQRLAWMLIAATIPVGIAGLLLEKTFRTQLATPFRTALFLALNGVLLIGVERLKSTTATATTTATSEAHGSDNVEADKRLAAQPVWRSVAIGAAQILALAPGISRSGATIAAGLRSKLDHEDAARFAFLLATPVILAAGALKLPDLTGPDGKGIGGQVLLGSVLSFIGAYVSLAFLTRFFRYGSLRPFGAYCLAAGIASAIYLSVR